MEKVNISYVDLNDNILFNEKRLYINLPKLEHEIIWHYCHWKVLKIVENWDKQKITIYFEFIKKVDN